VGHSLWRFGITCGSYFYFGGYLVDHEQLDAPDYYLIFTFLVFYASLQLFGILKLGQFTTPLLSYKVEKVSEKEKLTYKLKDTEGVHELKIED